MTMRHIPYTFINYPNHRVVPADFNGWQVQSRETEESEWVNVPNGWYKDLQKALDVAAVYCGC